MGIIRHAVSDTFRSGRYHRYAQCMRDSSFISRLREGSLGRVVEIYSSDQGRLEEYGFTCCCYCWGWVTASVCMYVCMDTALDDDNDK